MNVIVLTSVGKEPHAFLGDYKVQTQKVGESTIAMLTKYKMFYIKVSIITIRYSVVLQDKIQCIAPCFKLDKGKQTLELYGAHIRLNYFGDSSHLKRKF